MGANRLGQTKLDTGISHFFAFALLIVKYKVPQISVCIYPILSREGGQIAIPVSRPFSECAELTHEARVTQDPTPQALGWVGSSILRPFLEFLRPAP